mmetsp:Transcript_3356/g.4955  ORF Transcript_3356/g.4955 Transcript_3356/m.4955 type:complete len:109 (+) Transcript_3356:20-346(+)
MSLIKLKKSKEADIFVSQNGQRYVLWEGEETESGVVMVNRKPYRPYGIGKLSNIEIISMQYTNTHYLQNVEGNNHYEKIENAQLSENLKKQLHFTRLKANKAVRHKYE